MIKNNSSTRTSRPKAWRVALLWSVLVASTACSVPGRLYPVSPVLSGQILGAGAATAGAELDLLVASRDSLGLADRHTLEVEPGGGFRFDAIALALAGHEYGHTYRAWLSYHAPSAEPIIIWRAEWVRETLDGPVELDCDLRRKPVHGQPCQVRDGANHGWLVSLGEHEFQRSCASCHGAAADGDGPAASALSPPPPDLTRLIARHGGEWDHTAIIAWIDGRNRTVAHGGSAMPVWGPRLALEASHYATAEEMAAARIDAIVVFLESVQQP